MEDERSLEQIHKLIDQLTTTGKEELDKKLLKELFIICSKSEELIQFCNEQLIEQLSKNHAQIKFGVVLVINEFFIRSSYFRTLFVENHLSTFLSLTMFEILNPKNPKKPLKPIKIAQKLKGTIVQTLNTWNQKFGTTFPNLGSTCGYIEQSLSVQPGDEDNEPPQRQNENSDREFDERRQNILRSKLTALKADVDSRYDQIKETVTEHQNCFSLLVPETNTSSSETESDSEDDEVNTIPKSRIGVKINHENEDIVRKLNEVYHLCKRKYIPLITRWISTVGPDDQSLLQRIRTIRQLLHREVKKYERIKYIGSIDELIDDETDSEFEDVPEVVDFREEYLKLPIFNPVDLDDHSGSNIEHPITPSSSSSSKHSFSKTKPSSSESKLIPTSLFSETENNPEDPTTFAATLHCLTKGQAGTSKRALDKTQVDETCHMNPRKRKLLNIAPKVPFSVDLYHWEDEKVSVPTIILPESDSHRFWQPMDREGEELPIPGGLESIRTRRIEFTGEFKPVKWSCRARLPSGKICPRKDRVKCPLHGTIIARDESGNPTNPDDIQRLEAKKAEKEKNKPPDWQDPEFLKELKVKIGIDLTIKKSRKGKKTFAEQYPGLINIEKRVFSPKERLAKKIFSKKSRERVARSLDKLDEKRFKDKFGDQFNYAMFEND